MKKRAFDHVVIVMFENEYRGLVMQNETMKRLASLGVDMTNYFGTFHPSQTNYIASIAGEQCGWPLDSQVWPLSQQNTIVDLVEAAGLEWKAYMEDLPPLPWNPLWATPEYYDAPELPSGLAPPKDWTVPPAEYPSYWQKHNPFVSFLSNQFQMSRWQRIVALDQFFVDVEAGKLPHYSWITPNIWNDGHYLQGQGPSSSSLDYSILIDQIACWLEKDFLGPLCFPGPDSKLPPRTLVVLTFDESLFEDSGYSGPNRIYTVLLGDMVRAGTSETEPYNHYSLLRTIEENFDLGTLAKNDAGSNWFRFLWHERFAWHPPAPLPASTPGTMAAAAYDGRLFLVTRDAADQLQWQVFDGSWWSAPAAIAQQAYGSFALAAAEELLLVYRGADRQLFALPYTEAGGWATEPIALGVESAGSIAMTALPGGGGYILVYTGVGDGPELPISSMVIESPIQTPFKASPQPLDRTTDGALTLSKLGTTVYLVYSEPRKPDTKGSRMLMTSFETAFFNTVANGQDSTVAYRWAPPPPETPAPDGSLYVVGQISQDGRVVDSPPADDPTWIAPGSALALAELDGCMRLVATSAATGALVAETFSLCGVMTPEFPTQLNPTVGYGQGYGTLMEAGWGPIEDLDWRSQPQALAMAEYQGALWLFFVSEATGEVWTAVGRY